ncbi:MAG: ribonuclease J [Bradymonadaceae bacterium]|nr:ribonuclease J [Lujinxingiaceae bacterium]
MSKSKNKNKHVARTSDGRPEEDYVRFIPLGGLDEVGMNCSLIECNGAMLLVDCGITFPETDSFGIDIILPDWAYVLDNLDRLDGILITHGHEDHIGALPFFLREVDVPVYAGRLALGMLRKKLQSTELEGEVELYPVEAGDRLEIGPFVVEFVHVNHSIPDAMAIALETPLGRVLFTGDWRIDQTPLYEAPTDLLRLAEFGREGLLAIFADSTNAHTPGFTTSERAVKRGLSELFESVPGRIIIAQFSSNLHRMSGVIDLASRYGRKVALSGHSMVKNFGIARELGLVTLPDDKVLINMQNVRDYPDDEIVIITTGSQAEPRSALTRMAYGDHNDVKIGPTDTIVLSARQIPGNEYYINFMLNNLAKRGAKIITANDGEIHGSGHAQQDELKLMLTLTRPTYLVPVHGEYRMRKRHAELGVEVGVPHTRLIENGDILEITASGAQVIGHVHSGRLLVDGKNVGDPDDFQLRDRRMLATAGILVAVAVIDRDTGEMSAPPDLLQRGVVGPNESEEMLNEAAKAAWDAVKGLPADARRDVSEVSEAIRATIRRYFRRHMDRKPMVIPIVHEL